MPSVQDHLPEHGRSGQSAPCNARPVRHRRDPPAAHGLRQPPGRARGVRTSDPTFAPRPRRRRLPRALGFRREFHVFKLLRRNIRANGRTGNVQSVCGSHPALILPPGPEEVSVSIQPPRRFNGARLLQPSQFRARNQLFQRLAGEIPGGCRSRRRRRKNPRASGRLRLCASRSRRSKRRG